MQQDLPSFDQETPLETSSASRKPRRKPSKRTMRAVKRTVTDMLPAKKKRGRPPGKKARKQRRPPIAKVPAIVALRSEGVAQFIENVLGIKMSPWQVRVLNVALEEKS
jgi:hypothetical protein